jgi:hypothetical protein
MPIRKPRLSRVEEATHLDCLRQLQAEGLDVEIPEENSRALDIVVAGPAESTVFESASGGVCYAVLPRLVALQSGRSLWDWDMSTAYDNQIVPESFDGRDPVCTLGGQEYRACDVLNSRIEKRLVLSRGQTAEGWLLATGLARIPATYSNCAVVPFRLSFWDQFGNEFRVPGTLSVSRRVQRDNAKVRKGTGLYGLDGTGKPRQPSVEEDAHRRYLELIAQEKNAERQDAGESAEKTTQLIKRVAKLLGRPDLYSMVSD